MAYRTNLISVGKLLNNNIIKVNNARGMVALSGKKLGKNDEEPPEPVTHTGQAYAPNDYRRVRFLGKEKQVNPRFAIDLIAEVPPKAVDARVTWCDGGGGPTGHPRVYINLDKPGNHDCSYCGLRFYKADHHH